MSVIGLDQSDLESTRIVEGTYLSRRKISRLDAARAICFMLVLLLCIPAAYIVPGMSEMGRPALVVGLLLGVWWLLSRGTSHLVLPGPQPIRWALFVYALTMLGSYVVAQLRSLTAMEANGADRALLFLLAFSGIALAAADGITTWQRLNRVLAVMVACGAFMSIIALIQSLLAIDLVAYMKIPGLQARYDDVAFMARGSALRVASTTTHYIELSTTLATILPFALHLTLFAATKRGRLWAAMATVLLVAGIFVTVSRSGILGMGVAAVMLFPAWGWRRRYNVLVIAVALMVGLAVAKPSMIRTLSGMFTSAGDDSSVQVRTARYPMIFNYISQHPWFGRGTGTFIPPQYPILDNWWFTFIIANGFVGALALLTMHIIGTVTAIKAGRRAATPEVKHLAAAAASTQVIAVLVAGTYDSMSFLTYAAMVGLGLGLCGTVWRLTHPSRDVRTAGASWSSAEEGMLRDPATVH